ncbi:hypothetical protein VA249_41440 [Vibrio alfacsensis]|uniref:transcription termination/antitermination NusG family protein n=1 Tax=Vibrio alfacsensis TaxID=1074311 RepID=UPI001BEEA80F|nr:transcription termination/antitermination NusG family protein [Vibrio alfacsensis]BBM67498.1 hypothetical protein VA249_41440 [Vibrio alfacsensis]
MKSWYLLYCKRGERSRAFLNLKQQGIECFCPGTSLRNNASTRVKDDSLQNYIFAQIDHLTGPSLTTVRSTRGVVDFIRAGAKPQKITNDAVNDLKQQYKCMTMN